MRIKSSDLKMSHKLTVLPYLIKFTPKACNTLNAPPTSLNIYAFDLDHTLIEPLTPGSRFSRAADDWKFMSFTPGKTTFQKLIEIVRKDPLAQIVIFSNQGGVVAVPPSSKSCTKYTEKIKLILRKLSESTDGDKLSERLWVYASPKRPASMSLGKSKLKAKQPMITKYTKSTKLTFDIDKITNDMDVKQYELFDVMRKPEIGMKDQFEQDLKSHFEVLPDVTWCYYCGDAAGRPKDFSDSDKKFAHKLGISFKTPEELFT